MHEYAQGARPTPRPRPPCAAPRGKRGARRPGARRGPLRWRLGPRGRRAPSRRLALPAGSQRISEAAPSRPARIDVGCHRFPLPDSRPRRRGRQPHCRRAQNRSAGAPGDWDATQHRLWLPAASRPWRPPLRARNHKARTRPQARLGANMISSTPHPYIYAMRFSPCIPFAFLEATGHPGPWLPTPLPSALCSARRVARARAAPARPCAASAGAGARGRGRARAPGPPLMLPHEPPDSCGQARAPACPPACSPDHHCALHKWMER